MRLILTTVAAAALAAGVTAPAFAHGGAYRGPGGEVPADSREPSDPPPPPEGGGPGTPGGDNGGGPTTGGGGGGPNTGGGGDSGGPSTGGGGGGPPPSGGGGSGPTTGGVGKKAGGPKGPGYEDWTFWWNYNKDSLLNLKKKIKANAGVGTGTGLHGFGGRASGTGILPAAEGQILTEIVPALKDLLNAPAKEINADIQSAAELALAKIRDPELAPKLMEIASNDAGIYDKIVVESAALAFGMLQKETPEIREYLISLVTDPKRDGPFTRPFAAISLGLIGEKNDKDRAAANAFFKVIGDKEVGKNIKPASILGLGLLGNDKDVATLLEIAKTAKSPNTKLDLDDVDVAHAVSSLGRIGRAGLDKAGEETSVSDYLSAVLTDKRERDKAKINTVRSAAIALGQIGAKSTDVKVQKKILGTLKSVIADEDDNQSKHFAMVSVGRIGAAKDVDPGMRKDCLDVLRHHLDKGKQLTPTFAAMALGVVGQAMKENGVAVDDETIRKPLREKFAETKETRSRGAYAVALGLVGDAQAVPLLREVLKDKSIDAKLRGYAALGLGMIGSPDAGVREDIKNVLVNEDNRELRVQTAVAAGLMADASTIDEMVKILKDSSQSQYVLGSVALALGQLGDAKAITPLIEIAKDSKKYPDLTRALATVALGQIGDRADVPVLARVSTDINYRDQPSYEVELLTIL